MSLLQFVPWSTVKAPLVVGPFTLLPWDANQPDGFSPEEVAVIAQVLGRYVTLTGYPVRKAIVVRREGSGLLDDLADDAIAEAYEAIELLRLACLSNRSFFTPAPFGYYVNTDAITLIIQRFRGAIDATTVVARRADGSQNTGYSIREVKFAAPLHVDPYVNHELEPDSALLDTILKARATFQLGEWDRWADAIVSFNQANTDSGTISAHIEFVLLSAAFERLLKTSSKAEDVAARFAAAFLPSAERRAAGMGRLAGHDPKHAERSVREAWMLEFQRMRGFFAHGKRSPQKPNPWRRHEHHFMAVAAFPVTAKLLLAAKGFYELTDRDQAMLDAFEDVASCEDVMGKPGDMSYPWRRIVGEREQGIYFRRLFEGLQGEVPEDLGPPAGDSVSAPQ
jgi:hypothetical protein